MKQGLIAVSVLAVLIMIIVLAGQVYFSGPSVDIHLNDTYFVLNYSLFILLVLLLMLFVFSLVASVSTAFKNITYTRMLLVSVLGLLVTGFMLLRIQ